MFFKNYQYFLAVAEELNFTRAAKKLYISQQSLSNYIQKLESQYGVILFKRKPSLQLTSTGEYFLFYAKQLQQVHEQMNSCITDINRNYKGTISFGISRRRIKVFFEQIWKAYHIKHPNISISLIDGTSSSYQQLMAKGNLDLYIGINIQPSIGFRVIPLATEETFCVLHETLLKKLHPHTWKKELSSFSQKGLDLLNIADLPFIMLSKENRIRFNIDAYFMKFGIKPNIILDTNHQGIAFDLAQSGDGVALVSPIMFYDKTPLSDLLQKGTHIYPLNCNIPVNNICLVTHDDDYSLPLFLNDFILVIQKVFSEYDKIQQRLESHH